MNTLLKNIVQFTSRGPTTLPHGLNVNGVGVIPQFIATDADGFTVTADETTVTITNDDLRDVNIFVEHWHTIEAVVPLPDGLGALVPFVVATNSFPPIIAAQSSDANGVAFGSVGFNGGGHGTGTGIYTLTLASPPADLTQLAVTVSLQETTPGFVTYDASANPLVVHTFNQAGTPTDLAFSIVVLDLTTT